jgi:hypothetical protein
MVVLRAEDPDEAQAWINVAEQLAPTLSDLLTVYSPAPAGATDAVGLLQEKMGAEVVGSNCVHGPMVYKTGGFGQKEWAAWMCPAPQGDPSKCQPVDAKTGRPWPKR